MLYPYITFPDETEVTHSHIIVDGEKEFVEVHFERPTDNDFNSARCVLPDYSWKFNEGFSAIEIEEFEEFLRHNAHLFLKFAKQGGMC